MTSAKISTFIDIDPNGDFSFQNLPYGIVKPKNDSARIAVAIGEFALDLSVLEAKKIISTGHSEPVFNRSSLNHFARLGKATWSSVRSQIKELLSASNPKLRDDSALRSKAFLPLKDIQTLLPFEIGGFTDFYASKIHATNVGKLFRPDGEPLLPNWKHIPIAYNGRASSVVVDGTPFVRPSGQLKAPTATVPSFGPSNKLDIELEVGFFIGKENEMGRPISMAEATDYIFGMVLVNDWSARDIQAWEYVPLGPFLGKSFATTISPWVVPLEALEPFKVPMPPFDPPILPYISGPQFVYDLELSAELRTTKLKEPFRFVQTNSKHLYWSFAQQLVHHASNGCPMKVGDLLASGTISGPEQNSWGSLLEITYNGKQPIQLPNGETRSFLENGDEVTLRGAGVGNGYRVGFGTARGQVLER